LNLLTNLGGELAALSGALLWAVASVIYQRVGEQIPPLELNLLKGILALAMLSLTLLLAGEPPASLELLAVGLLLLGGAIRIGLGDTAFFESLAHLGPRRALLLGILAPPLAAVLALLTLGEHLTLGGWAGLLVTVLGVAWVVTERVPGSEETPRNLLRGIGFGLLATLAQATGVVLSRAAYIRTSASPQWGAFLQLAAGTVTLLIWIPLARQPLGRWRREGHMGQLWGWLLLAVFLGTYLVIWLQQVALALTSAGIALALYSTSPLFVLPLVLWTGEKVSLRAVLGAVVALTGVGLLFGLA
jgi:drug/metabolite transporter (DMT)-like permease